MIPHEFSEIIELTDSDDDDVVLLPSPPPAPARQPVPSPVRQKRPLREEPIDVDALEKEIIDLTDDSPARTTIALFEELPLSTEPSIPQTVPVQASPPSSTVSEEEPPPSSPEPEAMEVDLGTGVVGLTPSGTPPPNQDDDPLGPLEQTFSPISRIQSPIRTPRETTTLINASSPQRPSQQVVTAHCSTQSRRKADIISFRESLMMAMAMIPLTSWLQFERLVGRSRIHQII
jgi:hypothetical protein